MKNVEDLYPLAPLQEMLLAHALLAPGSAVGFEQKSTTLDGSVDLPVLERTWQRVVDRHPILRTSFLWESTARPLQVVRKQVRLPIEEHDWRALPAVEQGAKVEEFLRADQQRGFDLRRAPLMRLSLLRLADERYLLVWSYHHLLLDAWCRSVLLDEVLGLYQAAARGEERALAPARPYRDYIAWLARQDEAGAEAFWRAVLRGFPGATPLPLDGWEAGDAGAGYQVRHRRLSAELTAELQRCARQRHLTLGVLTQAAWALLLARHSGRSEATYGVTVAGRPADLPGVETIVGVFINNLPVRVEVPAGQAVGAWLSGLQERLVELRQFEHCSPAQIQQWSGASGGQRLFDSLVLFQNTPPRGAGAEAGAAPAVDESTGATLGPLRGRLETGYPLTLVASPASELLLRLFYRADRFAAAGIEQLLRQLERVLAELIADPERPLAEVPWLGEGEVSAAAPPAAERSARLERKRAAGEWTPPRDLLELRLVQLWERLFELRPIGVTDGFFELGGHSVLALHLMAEIRRELGQELPLTALLAGGGTIESLARRLRERPTPGEPASLVSLQPLGEEPPLFCIHPGGGGVLCYVELAYQLGTRQPVYGLKAPGWQDERQPLARLDEMAALYLEEIRRLRPRGPYRLLGWSFGGLVAFELARRLEAAGQEVELLAILDAGVGRAISSFDETDVLLQFLGEGARISAEELRRQGDLEQQITHLLRAAAAHDLLPADFDPAHARRLFEVRRGCFLAARDYVPGPYGGTLTLVRARAGRILSYGEPTLGWGALAARVVVREVPGGHEELVARPWVEAVAAELRSALERSPPAVALVEGGGQG